MWDGIGREEEQHRFINIIREESWIYMLNSKKQECTKRV